MTHNYYYCQDKYFDRRVTENYLMYFIFSLASRILYYKPAGIYIVKYGQ